MRFVEYSAITFDAYVHANKQDDIVKRKKEILESVFQYHRLAPKSLLFIGFNPAIMDLPGHDITVTQVTPEIVGYIRNHRPNTKYMEWDQMDATDSWDAVVAMDEFLTFAETEDQQHSQLNKFCRLANQVAITTLRDYKNQGFKDREFSIPSLVKGDEGDKIFLEYHDYDLQDRNAWTRSVYEIQGTGMRAFQGFQCRQMFFKQCAKFSLDAGAGDFLIHKNIMYKSLIKKNYEHVISMRFNKHGRFQPGRQHS